jgi:hypothetical protein
MNLSSLKYVFYAHPSDPNEKQIRWKLEVEVLEIQLETGMDVWK